MSSSSRNDGPTASTESPEGGPPTTSELRIDAIAAAVAAGLADPKPASETSPDDEPQTIAFELPDWADPPTGQVPQVLLDDPDADPGEVTPRKPTWRDQRDGWKDDEFDLSLLAAESDAPTTDEIAGTVLPEDVPFGFVVLDEPAAGAEELPGEGDEYAWTDLFDQPPPQRPRHAAHRRPCPTEVRRRPRRRSAVEPPNRRSGVVATITGAALGLVAVLCLLGGAAPTDALITVAGTLAAGEFFAVLQRSGYRPATLLGLLAVPACIVSAYATGPAGLALSLALTLVATGAWYLRRSASEAPLVDAALTLLVVVWIGALGGCAALIVAPAAYPHRHGVALVFGVIACTVAHDVGSYLVGSRLGRHRIAPRISPGKTLEGLIGGTVIDFAVALGLVARVHPFSFSTAAALAAVVACFAPLGDLIESMVKRDLGIKDMGTVLPAHGGVFDRVDAMLVAMPAAYLLFRIVNVG